MNLLSPKMPPEKVFQTDYKYMFFGILIELSGFFIMASLFFFKMTNIKDLTTMFFVFCTPSFFIYLCNIHCDASIVPLISTKNDELSDKIIYEFQKALYISSP